MTRTATMAPTLDNRAILFACDNNVAGSFERQGLESPIALLSKFSRASRHVMSITSRDCSVGYKRKIPIISPKHCIETFNRHSVVCRYCRRRFNILSALFLSVISYTYIRSKPSICSVLYPSTKCQFFHLLRRVRMKYI